MNNINNLMESVSLEIAVKDLNKSMDKLLNELDVELLFIDAKYNGKIIKDNNLSYDLHNWMYKLLLLVNKFKDIEFNAMKINDRDLYLKCKKSLNKLSEAMSHIRSLYM